ncbi:hypothetical protein [Fodinibius salsisoli]|uniref:Uncharacterized protein n=1 Tax=Fodinibius salsisoli TaxID=2820877 RepID=A0ABT3PQQ1_9BACT|nr:hypothetical protein [Fodinibius salsisoli]MCW9708185.1 hypothetical protein [Fodinibius salsisoli]
MQLKIIIITVLASTLSAFSNTLLAQPSFDSQTDLISLHYDHAPDRDDGHSAVADRMILQEQFGTAWLKDHILAVSGAYGINQDSFQPESDAVMDAVWGGCCGWVAADDHWARAVQKLYSAWTKTIASGGKVWVKEGGQSDLTADVLRMIQQENPDISINQSIYVVQHSDWNEGKTTDKDLEYVKETSHYIRISDANAFLNDRDGNTNFAQKALADPTYRTMWEAAFAYLDPTERVDFSDTGELIAILGLDKRDVDAFSNHYFDE